MLPLPVAAVIPTPVIIPIGDGVGTVIPGGGAGGGGGSGGGGGGGNAGWCWTPVRPPFCQYPNFAETYNVLCF